jgi:hypothetical protein
MKLNQANQKNTIAPIAQRAESLERSTERIQRQVKIIESDGPRCHLVILLRREAWINLKRSWGLFLAVCKMKAGPENEQNSEHKP